MNENETSPTLSIDKAEAEGALGHPFGGTQEEVGQLKEAIATGNVAAFGDYVGAESSDRQLAPFDANPDKIVISFDQAGWFSSPAHYASVVTDGALDRTVQFNLVEGGRSDKLFDPSDTQPWSTHIVDYAADGHVTADQTVNDDGSYSLRVNNTDGSHAITTGTPDGSEPAAAVTGHYDAADRLVTETAYNVDGSETTVTHDAAGTQTWAAQTASFDLNYNLRSETIDYDDGWRSVRVNDLDAAQSWTSMLTVTNASHQVEWQDRLNDDGSQVEAGFNNSGVGDWTSYVANFQNGWQETSETDHYVDGSRAEVTYDTAGQSFDYTANWYDAAGNLFIQDTVNDNGTATETVYNTAGVDDWTSYTATFDANQNETGETDRFADGTRAEVAFDVSGQTWDTTVAWYDAANHLMVQDVNYDNGTSTETGYDTTGESWTSYVANYDAAGHETTETVYWDGNVGGGHSDYVWNGNAYTEYDYNSSGQLYATYTGTGGDSPESFGDQQPVDYSGGDVGFFDGGFGFGDSPVVLDLDGNGIDLALRDASTASFDLIATTAGRERTTWVAGNDGLLAIDLAANGQAAADGVIDQAKEIVFTRWAPGTATDMAALRAVFDTNHNGALDPADARWNEFRVWRDSNRNGVSEAGELVTLTQLGIVLLALSASGVPLAFADGSAINGLASYTRANGTTGIAADATFAPDGDISLDAAHANALVNVKLNADGSTTSEITERDDAGHLVEHRITTTAANRVDVQADVNGDGKIDRQETSLTYADGSKFIDQKDLGIDGSVLMQVATAYDPSSVHGWLSQVQRLDGAGHLASETDTGADGARTVSLYDVANMHNWSSQVSTYDAAGALVLLSVTNDDGSKEVTAFGAAGSVLAGGAFNDTLAGAAGDDVLIGDAGNDHLFGGGGDDVLFGGAGDDTMAGGPGQDSYIVDASGDQVSESAGEGYDAIFTDVSYALPANVEQVVLTGADALDLVATVPDETLVGNLAANQFTVGPGADLIIGRAGIDTVVFSGNRADYAISFDNTDTQSFTVTDLRTGSPDGINTISGVEFFKFGNETVDTPSLTAQTVNSPDGTRTVTTYDAADSLPWSTRVSSYDAAGHLTAEGFQEDNGTRWTNTYDASSAFNWTSATNNYDGNGSLISKLTIYDDNTRTLQAHDNAGTDSWADFTVTFDANWNIVTQSGTHDDGSPLIAPEIDSAYDTVVWYTRPVDPARDFVLG